ncbi:hypothetical protein [Allonocardiopsis opalescens]|uniref:Uncharacterized protein n=1 Tax=Allonocardiopsis opalescens TaxID=1144618 RepID=A0A2T0PYE8_9ACTN|nr:hypothetical protein [Allonocardiopsis opalescens]PRX96538.1 hypothetical protein CLV72_10761 [Allonocardiopsis opalescens]
MTKMDAERLRARLAAAAKESSSPTDVVWARSGRVPEKNDEDHHRLGAQRLAANRRVNYLTPVMLNACHKAVTKKELSKLEASLLRLAKIAMPHEGETGKWGKAFAELSTDQRNALFPEKVAHLTPDSTVTHKDAVAWMPEVWNVIQNMPNVAKQTEIGKKPKKPKGPEVQRHGWTRLIPVPPKKPQHTTVMVGGSADAERTAPEHTCVLHLGKVKCLRVTAGEPGDDEVYFTFEVISNSPRMCDPAGRSKTVEGFNNDVEKDYNEDVSNFTVLMPDGKGGFIPLNEMFFGVQAWEEDHKDPDFLGEFHKIAKQVSKDIEEALQEPTKRPYYIGHAIGLVFGLVDIITSWLTDDLIAADFVYFNFPEGPTWDRSTLVQTWIDDWGDEHENQYTGKYEVELSVRRAS